MLANLNLNINNFIFFILKKPKVEQIVRMPKIELEFPRNTVGWEIAREYGRHGKYGGGQILWFRFQLKNLVLGSSGGKKVTFKR